MSDPRAFPDRPFLAVSAAIVREGKVLIVKRERPPASGRYTLPGGVVEAGETLMEAVTREVREETGISVEVVALAGHREAILKGTDGRAERHFVILCFAARWVAGEFAPSDEVADAQWMHPSELVGLHTTDGLAEIVDEAFARLAP